MRDLRLKKFYFFKIIKSSCRHYIFCPTVDCPTDFSPTGPSPNLNNFPNQFIYAMVGIRPNWGNRWSEKQWSGKRCSDFHVHEIIKFSNIFFKFCVMGECFCTITFLSSSRWSETVISWNLFITCLVWERNRQKTVYLITDHKFAFDFHRLLRNLILKGISFCFFNVKVS